MPRAPPKTPKRKTNKDASAAIVGDEDDNADVMDVLASANSGVDENLLEMEIPPMPEPLMSADSNGERLIISHIEVENFKSYYGRQTIGPFHQNFTAIIGPNGSGKSNVIDSLLFVFGYRASKIRSKKISVLIHSSAGREDITSCTVSVYFKKILVHGPDVVETVVGSNFFVSRTAYRDNSSRYTLDGRTTQFYEIAIVLRRSGIDLVHNRFLILQGEVEHISLMKPKAQNENEEGMLEYLEDIIGSSRLKAPINKLVSKLGRLQEQRAYQLVRLHHAEKELQALRVPATAVIGRLRLENAVAVAQVKLYSIKKLAVETEVETLKTLHAEHTVLLTEKQQELDALTANSKDLKGEHKQLQRDLEKKQKALTALGAELGVKKQAIMKMKNEKKRKTEQLGKLEINIAKEREKIAELEGLPERAAQKLADYERELADAEEAICTNTSLVDERLSRVQEQTAALSADRQMLEVELGRHIMVEDKCAAELTLAQEALTNLQREESAQRRILAEYCDRLTQITDSLTAKSRQLEGTKANLPSLERDLAKLRADETRLIDEECRLSEETRLLRVDVEQARQAAAQFQTNNSLLRALMAQKKSGKIRGIYGRLGDLGAIDAKYDVAISTTCGALDNIVVDNVETAQQCIKFLQRENLGIASFIALDKQQHFWQRIRNKPKTPENTPRLFDLVRVEDENVLPAFYYALNDTLVAADIHSATRIGMNSSAQRWRTVTLKGEVVEVSGAMTGGGKAQRSGRIGREVRVNTAASNGQVEVDGRALAERLQAAEQELTDVRSKLTSCSQGARERQTELTRAAQMAKNLTTDVELLQKNVETARRQIEDQKRNLGDAIINPEIIQEHDERISQLKKENDEYSQKSNSLRLRSIAIAEAINRIEEEIVGPQQRALRDAEERKRSTEKGIAKEKNAITSNARNLRNANGRLVDLEGDLEQVISSINKLTEKIDTFIADLTALEAQADECRATIAAAEAAYNEMVERTHQLNAGEIEAGRRVAELRDELAAIDEQLSKANVKIIAIEARILKLKLYDLRQLDKLAADLLEQGKDDPLLADSLAVLVDAQAELAEGQLENVIVGDVLGEEDESMEVTDKTNHGDEDEPAAEGHREGRQNVVMPVKRATAGGGISTARISRFDAEMIMEFDVTKLKAQLEELEARQRRARRDNAANIGVLTEYIQKAKFYDAELADFQQISRERDVHREFCERLKRQRLQEFMDGFQTIKERLKQLYQMITLGGDASLDLVDSLDPFSEGVSFGVRPPKKSWKQITNLSGGEKTLASLALVFGLHRFRPTPLYVMDEIDAALDFRNVSIISSYILERTTNAQFIVISLRNNMFERGNRLVGIYKVHDCTHNVVLDPVAAQKQLVKNMKAINYAKTREEEENPEEAQSRTARRHILPNDGRRIKKERDF